MDDAFLAEIERWRDLLAHNIALRNPALSQRELNFAVQMTIDRIIFLRICEDRGIELYGQLQALLNGGDVYARLCRALPQGRRSLQLRAVSLPTRERPGRCARHSDPGLDIDDKPLKDIIEQPVLPRKPLRVLGAARRHPGAGLRAVPGQGHPPDRRAPGRGGRQARGEEGRRGLLHAHLHRGLHRQAYRGQAAARRQSPGRLALGKGAPLRILDPACGSGSFLLGAYQYLLDWYLDGYAADRA